MITKINLNSISYNKINPKTQNHNQNQSISDSKIQTNNLDFEHYKSLHFLGNIKQNKTGSLSDVKKELKKFEQYEKKALDEFARAYSEISIIRQNVGQIKKLAKKEFSNAKKAQNDLDKLFEIAKENKFPDAFNDEGKILYEYKISDNMQLKIGQFDKNGALEKLCYVGQNAAEIDYVNDDGTFDIYIFNDEDDNEQSIQVYKSHIDVNSYLSKAKEEYIFNNDTLLEYSKDIFMNERTDSVSKKEIYDFSQGEADFSYSKSHYEIGYNKDIPTYTKDGVKIMMSDNKLSAYFLNSLMKYNDDGSMNQKAQKQLLADDDQSYKSVAYNTLVSYDSEGGPMTYDNEMQLDLENNKLKKYTITREIEDEN